MAHTINGVWLNCKVGARLIAQDLWQQVLDRSLQETHCSLQHMNPLLAWGESNSAMHPKPAHSRQILWDNGEMCTLQHMNPLLTWVDSDSAMQPKSAHSRRSLWDNMGEMCRGNAPLDPSCVLLQCTDGRFHSPWQ